MTKGFTFKTKLDLTDNELEVVLCGGQLRYLKRELVKQGVIDKEELQIKSRNVHETNKDKKQK